MDMLSAQATGTRATFKGGHQGTQHTHEGITLQLQCKRATRALAGQRHGAREHEHRDSTFKLYHVQNRSKYAAQGCTPAVHRGHNADDECPQRTKR